MAQASAKSPRFSSSFAVVLGDGLAIETTYGLSILSEGRPITVRSVEEKLVRKKFPGKTREIPLEEIHGSGSHETNGHPPGNSVSLNRFIVRVRRATLAKFVGSIGQKMWCLTFHFPESD